MDSIFDESIPLTDKTTTTTTTTKINNDGYMRSLLGKFITIKDSFKGKQKNKTTSNAASLSSSINNNTTDNYYEYYDDDRYEQEDYDEQILYNEHEQQRVQSSGAKLIQEILTSGNSDIDLNIIVRKRGSLIWGREDGKINITSEPQPNHNDCNFIPRSGSNDKWVQQKRIHDLFALDAAPVLIAIRNLGWISDSNERKKLENEIFKVKRKLDQELIRDYKEPLLVGMQFCGDINTAAAAAAVDDDTTWPTSESPLSTIVETSDHDSSVGNEQPLR